MERQGLPAMYQANPEFEQPNENERVWRYMDFTKLVSLLHSRTLYFARADKFDDPFEGSYPAKNVSRYRDYHESLNLPPDVHRDLVPLLNDGMSTFVRRCRKWTALNCWHWTALEATFSQPGLRLDCCDQRSGPHDVDDAGEVVGPGRDDRVCMTLPWREQDSNHRSRVTRPIFQVASGWFPPTVSDAWREAAIFCAR